LDIGICTALPPTQQVLTALHRWHWPYYVKFTLQGDLVMITACTRKTAPNPAGMYLSCAVQADQEPELHVGLRYMDGSKPPGATAAAAAPGGGAGDAVPMPTIGDGGASWRLKALKRAQQLAKEEGKDVSEVCVGALEGWVFS
jgi:hypothetical protein